MLCVKLFLVFIHNIYFKLSIPLGFQQFSEDVSSKFDSIAYSVGGSSKEVITFNICRRIVKSHISDFRWTNRSIWKWK